MYIYIYARIVGFVILLIIPIKEQFSAFLNLEYKLIIKA